MFGGILVYMSTSSASGLASVMDVGSSLKPANERPAPLVLPNVNLMIPMCHIRAKGSFGGA